MRLHEHEAKELFRQQGIAVPRGELAADGPAAAAAARKLGGPVVVKAQVLAGGRGRDGGVELAPDAARAGEIAAAMLARPCRGLRPELVLVEERLPIEREVYAAITVDPEGGCPAALLGRGGVDVEDRAHSGAAPARFRLHPEAGLTEAQARQLAAGLALAPKPAAAVARVLCQLWEVFRQEQALTAEINPLALLADGTAVAADAVVELDDAALAAAGRPVRDDGLATRRERGDGMTFVELGGDIGLVCSGAGLGMATMDLVAEQARPANFLETGGGISRGLMDRALTRVLACPGVKGVLINVYGGINPIHEGAQGVADVMARGVAVPVVAKALGNHQEETWEILERAGVAVVREVASEAAVEALLQRIAAAPEVGPQAVGPRVAGPQVAGPRAATPTEAGT